MHQLDVLQIYRRPGLVVDDDFERGISPLARTIRTTMIAVLIVCIAACAGVMVRSRPLGQMRASKSRARPSIVRPERTLPAGPLPPLHAHARASA